MANGEELTEAEQRHFWRLRWLSSLHAFTDTAVQTTRWADPEEPNPHYSFVECMCCYFDDADLAEHDSYQRRIADGYLISNEANAVAKFHLLAERYRSPRGDDYDVNAILSDPAWLTVVEAAQRAQACLLLLLSNPFEVAALIRPAIWKNTGYGFQGNYPDP